MPGIPLFTAVGPSLLPAQLTAVPAASSLLFTNGRSVHRHLINIQRINEYLYNSIRCVFGLAYIFMHINIRVYNVYIKVYYRHGINKNKIK